MDLPRSGAGDCLPQTVVRAEPEPPIGSFEPRSRPRLVQWVDGCHGAPEWVGMRGEQAHATSRSYPQPAVPIFEQGVNRIVRQAVARPEVLNLLVQTSAVESMFKSNPQRALAIY